MTKYLIIGGHGFIGHHLYHKILKEDPEASIDIYDTDIPTGNPSEELKKLRTVGLPGSIPLTTLASTLYDYLFHLGSIAGVRYNIDPGIYFTNNNAMLQSYIENINYKKFIYISSSSVLGEKPTPYCYSKKIAEAQVQQYILHPIIIRPFTVYGELGRPDMLITKLLNKEKVVINGNGELCRYFTYVGDLVECIFSKRDGLGIINAIGTKQYTVNEVIQLFGAKCSKGKADDRDFTKYNIDNAEQYLCETKLEDYIRRNK